MSPVTPDSIVVGDYGKGTLDSEMRLLNTLWEFADTDEERAELFKEFRGDMAVSFDYESAIGLGIGIGGVGKWIKGKWGKGKPVNLPLYKKVKIDMEEVISGHTSGGNRAKQSKIKDLFSDNMSEKQIENAIIDAYKTAKKIQTQGDRVKLQGYSNGTKIEMWFNTKTKVIETAYPKY
jgi:hypothetical protein